MHIGKSTSQKSNSILRQIKVIIKFGYSEKAKIWRYFVASNFKWKIFSNFVAFSEYPNFNDTIIMTLDRYTETGSFIMLKVRY